MENQQSLKRLEAELKRRGLPRAYIQRLVGELNDHITDVLEERSSSVGAARKLYLEPQNVPFRDSQLEDIPSCIGDATQLAIFVADQYRSRTFWGRHPWLTFAVMPLPLLTASIIVFCGGLAAVLHGLNWFCLDLLEVEPLEAGDFPLLQGVAIALVGWYILVVPALATGLLLCRIYRRNATDWRWAAAGCAMIACVLACVTFTYQIASEPTPGSFAVGLYASTSARWMLTTFLPKFALALVIGLLLIRRAQQAADGETEGGNLSLQPVIRN